MSRVFRTFKIFGWIIRFLFILLIAFVCGLLCWRLCSSQDPQELRTLSVNQQTYEAYAEKGEDLYIFRQEQRSITSGKDNYGYFSAKNTVFLPDANQVQLTVRYNNGTIRSLAEDFALDAVPSRDEELFDISLLLAIDLTPENTEDNLTNDPESVRFVRCHPTMTEQHQKNLYNYRKVVFNVEDCGEDMAELLESNLLLAVYVDVYYAGSIDYEQTPYGTLCLYDYLGEKETVRLTARDKEALAAWGREHSQS